MAAGTDVQVDELLDTDLLDEIADAVPCQMTLWPDDRPCPATAAQIARIYVRGLPTATMLLCTSHADFMARHLTTCPSCSRWIRVEFEPINRRPT